MKKNIIQNIKSFILVLALVLGVGYAYANFTAPKNSPPTCNTGDPGCDAPINVSATAQAKNGSLTLGGTAVPTASYKLNVPGLASFNGVVTQALTITAGAGANKVLTSDANGAATWQNATTGPGGGGNINAYSAVLTNSSIIRSTLWTDIGLSVTVTPSSPNSKFLINADAIGMNADQGGNCGIGLFKDATELVAPYSSNDASSWEAGAYGVTYLDLAGNTTSRTYNIKARAENGNASTGYCAINRSPGSTSHVGASTMTVLEIN